MNGLISQNSQPGGTLEEALRKLLMDAGYGGSLSDFLRAALLSGKAGGRRGFSDGSGRFSGGAKDEGGGAGFGFTGNGGGPL